MSVDFPEPVRPARRITGVVLTLSRERSGTGGRDPESIFEVCERSGYGSTLSWLGPGDDDTGGAATGGRGGTEVAVYVAIGWLSTGPNGRMSSGCIASMICCSIPDSGAAIVFWVIFRKNAFRKSLRNLKTNAGSSLCEQLRSGA